MVELDVVDELLVVDVEVLLVDAVLDVEVVDAVLLVDDVVLAVLDVEDVEDVVLAVLDVELVVVDVVVVEAVLDVEDVELVVEAVLDVEDVELVVEAVELVLDELVVDDSIIPIVFAVLGTTAALCIMGTYFTKISPLPPAEPTPESKTSIPPSGTTIPDPSALPLSMAATGNVVPPWAGIKAVPSHSAQYQSPMAAPVIS